MPGTTAIAAARYLESSDAPAIHTGTENLAKDLDKFIVGRFASTGARDTAIPTPTAGQICVTAGVMQQYLGGVWVNLVVPRLPVGILYDAALAATTSASTTDVTIGSTTVSSGWATGTRLVEIVAQGMSQGTVVGSVSRVAVTLGSNSAAHYVQNLVTGASGRGSFCIVLKVHASAAAALSASVQLRRATGSGDVSITPGTMTITDLGGV